MINLRSVDEAYQISAAASIRRAPISHDLFRQFSTAVDRLMKTLGDATEEELWKRILQPLKRYRFSLISAPLPFNNPTLSIVPAIEAARAQLQSYQQVHPLAAQKLAALLELAAALHSCRDNPILTFILEQFPQGVFNGAILLKDSRLITQTHLSLRRHPATRSLAVVTAGQLKKDKYFAQLLILGAAKWFPDYIFTAPRATQLAIVRYSWIRDAVPTPFRFVEHAAAMPVDAAKGATTDTSLDEMQFVEAEELLPRVDWDAIHKSILSNSEATLDHVPARIVALEGDYGVFLEDDESATVLMLDLDTDEPAERVRRTSVHNLLPGIFILLRTTGGGDYILPIADRLLGASATQVRSYQKDWKAKLRAMVVQSSLFRVSIQLRESGSLRASEMNVRNWMSSRNIKTHDPKDFAAIMRLIGLQDRTEEYWNSMAAISHAHQRAGQQIRRVLLRRLQDIDSSNLERDGRLDISLPEVDSGTLTAFRVVDVAPTHRLVGATKLNHPFSLGDTDASYSPG